MFTTKLCQSAEEVKQCLDIRIEVFVQEQHFTMEDEIDEKDGPSDHILLLNEVFIPIGTIRWFPPLNKLGRLAILKEYRGKGLGYKLVKALEDHLVSRVGKGGIGNQGKDDCLIVVNSQKYAVPFYEKCGYIREGEYFLEDGEDHMRLVKTLLL